MQTNLADFIKDTPEGQEAEEILRTCVHCGFCLAACPTYQLLGDELDSPRGRIYLMKQVMEGAPVTEKTQLHLDRCLTCRACETVCPSGVRYGRLVDIGRSIVEKKVGRNLGAGTMRYALRRVLPNSGMFSSLLKLGQAVRPLLPGHLLDSIPPAQTAQSGASSWPAARHARKMLILEGCVQPGLAPNINAATARVLDRLGISLIKAANAGCCGAVSYHLNAQQEGLDYMRRNVDAWWPYIASGPGIRAARGTKGAEAAENFDSAEAIVITASGCGVTVKDYGHLLRHDPVYAGKAARVSAMAKDISEIVDAETRTLMSLLDRAPDNSGKRSNKPKLAFHSPCTLQHGMNIRGVAEKILIAAGFELTYVPDAHLCCGSAGTYSILQPELSQRLLVNKVAALESGAPARIATANIGCLMHVRGGTSLPVDHWIEILDEKIRQDDEQTHAEPVPAKAPL
ncbi:glycolate oxidase subunit GlcF [Nitrosovibrio tenuis]|uniref:Glycolate oxidase iron-sulfur subunit n=1 Tax=Nitrosovibrio tenuis TaxID=1233 RepID=A0A1H7RQ08_9PROT|nr:glycolate oxidase subunit GlcF [Nitrosovibrio tenuis]SEL61924.1 glycolate oxidase iron-sulfur subunit [Nitrosovibrio tenuis]